MTRAKIGRYASKNGVATAARRFSRELKVTINESTVRGIKRAYLAELNRKGAREDDLSITVLPSKKCVCPLPLSSQLDAEVQKYISSKGM